MKLSSEKGNTKIEMIRSKLASNTGASITFALLIFLVCAVISAAVLVAATAASGRMAGIAETDQKFYSVNSAANIIRDLMDEQVVSTFKYDGTQYRFNRNMNEINSSVINDTSHDNALDTLPEYIANAYFSGKRSFTVDLSPSIPAGASSGMALASQADVSIDEYGNTTFTIYDNTNLKYKLIVSFAADVDDTPPPLPEDESKPVTDPHEISFHINRIVTAYDAARNN